MENADYEESEADVLEENESAEEAEVGNKPEDTNDSKVTGQKRKHED